MNRNFRKGLWIVSVVWLALVATFLLDRAIAGAKPPLPKLPNLPDNANFAADLPDNANFAAAPPVNAANAPKWRDRGKNDIEAPTETILAEKTAPSPAAPGEGFVNPKVQPGKVGWHSNFEAACSAAQYSGKPVLLFQMMGQLDDRFC